MIKAIFSVKRFFGDNRFENVFVDQPLFITLVLEEDKGSEHLIPWGSKLSFKTKFYRLRNVFFPKVKRVFMNKNN